MKILKQIKNKVSQHSWRASKEIANNFNRKRSYDNPYEKKEINYDKGKKTCISEKKQPKSWAASNHKSSKPNSGQRSPNKNSNKGYFQKYEKKVGNIKSKSKSNKRNRNLSASAESIDDTDFNPVYIDTGGSNMQ